MVIQSLRTNGQSTIKPHHNFYIDSKRWQRQFKSYAMTPHQGKLFDKSYRQGSRRLPEKNTKESISTEASENMNQA